MGKVLVVLGLVHALFIPIVATADPGGKDKDDVEVLARGPVHEAYAEPLEANPVPTPVVGKEPPAPIDELPPEQKPAGDNVVWLPGYWSYDSEREDFIWVSGFWRIPPPNRTWVPGSWRKLANGWQWVGGFWSVGEQQASIQYLPEPPKNLDAGPATPAPSPTAVYVPGVWVWRDRYVWRPGYWAEYRSGWIWIPAHYRWTPAGYVYIEGYWDYPLAQRGMLFAPVYIPRTVYVQPAFYYSPTIVVRDDCMYGALFVRRGYSSYYFGDYFAPAYAAVGYTSWVGYSGGTDVVVVRGWHDPMFNYYRVTYRDDPYWRGGITELYVGRYRGDVPRPPRTLVQQNTIIQNTTIVNNNIVVNNKTTNVNNVTMLSSVNTAAKVKNVQLQNVPVETRRQQMTEARQVQAFAQQRGQAEAKLTAQDGAKPAAPRTMTLEMPKNYAARANPPKVETKTPPASGKAEGKLPTIPVTNEPKGGKVEGKLPTIPVTNEPKGGKVEGKLPTIPGKSPPVGGKAEPKSGGGIVIPPKVEPKSPAPGLNPAAGPIGSPPALKTPTGTDPKAPAVAPKTPSPPMNPPPKSPARPKSKDKEKG